MAHPNANGNALRKPPVPLTLLDQGSELEDDEETYIVVGEAGEDVAFEVCEDLEIALGVRDAMMEDGFAVRLYQAVEIEVVTDDEPAARFARRPRGLTGGMLPGSRQSEMLLELVKDRISRPFHHFFHNLRANGLGNGVTQSGEMGCQTIS